jgi:uncharacterized protein YecE (DUF72 family)
VQLASLVVIFTDEQRAAWRARREARRAKQRVENVGRAKTMRAARIAAKPEGIKPASPSFSPSYGVKPEIYVGCSGWYYWHWKGQFYPESIPRNAWFRHYADKFNTVELNAPFYSWPTVGTIKQWLRQAGRKKFVYTVKVSELITHVKRFHGVRTLVRDFGYIADLLGPRMGCFLYQLPPSWHYTPARLRLIVNQLDLSRKNVVEFRHKSWWNDKVYQAFEKVGIIFCSSSGPRLPDELINTADDVYIRFHGTKRWYRHDYTREELVIWADRIRVSGAKRIWAYFNNDREGFALKNARQLMKLLRAKFQQRRTADRNKSCDSGTSFAFSESLEDDRSRMAKGITMAKVKANSSSAKKSAVKRRSRVVAGSQIPSDAVPGGTQDPKRRLGNFTGAGEHARIGGRTSGIVGQTTKRGRTDKRGKVGKQNRAAK